MTPKKKSASTTRFERIEKYLEGMADWQGRHDVAFDRIDRTIAETLSASNARFVRIEATLEQIAAGQAKHDAVLDRHDAAMDRIDRVLEFIAGAQAHLTSDIAELAQIIKRHTSDGHGSEGEEEEP
jgi:hypothetical protein